jgi:hypothetical protein
MNILIDQKPYTFPQSFNELTTEQIAVYVKEFILNRNALFEADKDGNWTVKNEMLYNKAMMRMLFYLMPLTWHEFTQMDNSWKHYLVYEAKLLQFLFTDSLTQIPILEVKIGDAKLHGPKTASLLATEEFSYADKTYQAYFKRNDKRHLNVFFATLFRPAAPFNPLNLLSANYNGDTREVFNKHLLEQRSFLVDRIPYDTKLAVWFWYHSYRATLPKIHKHVFTPSNETKAGDSDWLSVILAISADGPFGKYKEVCNTQVHLVLTDLENKAKQNEEIKQKYAKQ